MVALSTTVTLLLPMAKPGPGQQRALGRRVRRRLRRPMNPWNAENLEELAPRDMMNAGQLVRGDMGEHCSADVEKPLSENTTLRRLLSMHRRGLGP